MCENDLFVYYLFFLSYLIFFFFTLRINVKSDSMVFYQNLVQTLNDFHKTFDAAFNVINERHFLET